MVNEQSRRFEQKRIGEPSAPRQEGTSLKRAVFPGAITVQTGTVPFSCAVRKHRLVGKRGSTPGLSTNRTLCFWSQNHFTLIPRSLESMNACRPTQRE